MSTQNNFLSIVLRHSTWRPPHYIILSNLTDTQVNSKCIFLALVVPLKPQIYHQLFSNISSWSRHLLPKIEFFQLSSNLLFLKNGTITHQRGVSTTLKVFLISLFPLLPLPKPSDISAEVSNQQRNVSRHSFPRSSTKLIWGTASLTRASQMAVVEKNLPANAGGVRDKGLICGSGRSPGGGHGNPLLYSYLENHLDRGAWQATVYGVVEVGHD